MRLTVSTWNINSVRLRIDLVRRFLDEAKPDLLCLQETKCPDDRFPLKELQGFGYPHVVFAGQKGYNGVAILSRLPLVTRGDEVDMILGYDAVVGLGPVQSGIRPASALVA